MMPPTDSPAARHTGGWIALGGLFILACFYFKLPQPTAPSLAPGEKIHLGIDVNRATPAELACIPGVGDELAKRIVNYRQSHGPFESLSQLEEVPGVGPAKAAQLAESLLPLPLTDQPTRIAAAPSTSISVPRESPTGKLHD